MQQTLRYLQVVFPISHGWGASSVGRALRSQRRGRGFNSPALHQPSLELRQAGQTKFARTGGSSDEASVSLRHQINTFSHPQVECVSSANRRSSVFFVGG